MKRAEVEATSCVDCSSSAVSHTLAELTTVDKRIVHTKNQDATRDEAMELNETLKPHHVDEPFVMPARRGIGPNTPGFDLESYLDLVSEDVTKIQREKLREILARNSEVEYLHRHGLNGRTDLESFRNHVPLATYQDLEPDFLRLRRGEKTHIFTVDPLTAFYLSSGTSAGQPKYIPTTAREYEHVLLMQSFMLSVIRRAFTGFKAGKALSIGTAGKLTETPSGIKAGSLSTIYYRSEAFQQRPYDAWNQEYCVPQAVILCEDGSQGVYCHLLCGLAQSPELGSVNSLFAASLVGAVRALQKQWPEICEDIKTGTLNAKITDLEVRTAVEKTLKPNPHLASFVERECSKDDWEGILPRLFPNARFVAGIMSGSMQQYVPALRHFAGDLPCISPVYMASECSFIGLNVNPKCAPEDIAYMIWPETAFYEFLPLDTGAETKDLAKPAERKTLHLVEAADVELGKEYEIVVTTDSGLYRYCLSDVLKVKGFRKTAPIFEFVRRKNVILSVYVDKTDEEELQKVVDKAAKLLQGASMVLSAYTSTTDISSVPGHYLLFWELVDSRNLDKEVLQECANTLDASLNQVYREYRSINLIAPLEVRVVKEGTFDQVMELAVSRGTSPSQYKFPRYVNDPATLNILNEGVIASILSVVTLSAQPPYLPGLPSPGYESKGPSR